MLQNTTELVSKIKNEVIKYLLKELESVEKLSEEELKIKEIELKNTIMNNELIMQIRPQNEILDADLYNLTLNEIYTDLLTLFALTDAAEQKIDNHFNLDISKINNLKKELEKINDKLTSIEEFLNSKTNLYIHTENFRDMDCYETSDKFYTERYNEKMHKQTYAYYDPKKQTITLNPLHSKNMLYQDDNISFAKVYINKQLGEGFVKVVNENNKIDNILDTSDKTYWCETILSNKPITMQYTDNVLNKDYGINFGAACEIVISFENVTKVNEIILNPYGLYPMELIAIRYSTSDDPETKPLELIAPFKDQEHLKSKILYRETSIKFEEINCKNIYILFNQIHYTRNSVSIDKNELFKNNLWLNNIIKTNNKPLLYDEILFKPLYKDRTILNPLFTYINNLMNKSKNIKTILTKDKDYTTFTKYEYTYGFYNIALNYNAYEQTSVYISKPINVKNNIHSVEIETDEYHYKLENGKQLTDIEYYISYKEDPLYDDWFPILPKNIDTVENELLILFDDKCILRFPATEILNVFRDDKPLIKDVDYTVLSKTLDDTGEEVIYALIIPYFDQSNKYTVSYVPHYSSYKVSFVNNGFPLTMIAFENINGNDTAVYELKNNVFIADPNKISTNVKLINKTTGQIISEDTGELVCVTDPYNPYDSYKNITNNTDKFMYYTDKNYIYFNKNITNDYIIEISYEHYVSYIRLKAIFRRNSKEHYWNTPELKGIKYYFTTLD